MVIMVKGLHTQRHIDISCVLWCQLFSVGATKTTEYPIT